MDQNLQTLLSLIIVFVTALIVFYCAFRKKKDGCNEGCGCSAIPQKTSKRD